VSLVLERGGYFDFLNPVTSPEGGAPRSVFSNQMLQAQNSFGRFAPTPDRFSPPLQLRFHNHGVSALAIRAGVAFAKDLHPFRLQAFNECRVSAIENPKFEFRNSRQRNQFLQLRYRGLEQNAMVSYGMESDMRLWFTFLIASFWILGKQRRSSGE
jgi:hypothetical protein